MKRQRVYDTRKRNNDPGLKLNTYKVGNLKKCLTTKCLFFRKIQLQKLNPYNFIGLY